MSNSETVTRLCGHAATAEDFRSDEWGRPSRHMLEQTVCSNCGEKVLDGIIPMPAPVATGDNGFSTATVTAARIVAVTNALRTTSTHATEDEMIDHLVGWVREQSQGSTAVECNICYMLDHVTGFSQTRGIAYDILAGQNEKVKNFKDRAYPLSDKQLAVICRAAIRCWL